MAATPTAPLTLTPSRALRRPPRLDLRGLVGVLLLFVATGGSIGVWSALSDSRGVVVATRDLPAGAALGAGDLAVAQVRVDDAMYRAAVPAGDLPGLVGRQLAEPAHARQLLTPAQVSARPPLAPDRMAVAVPVGPTSAAGGRLRPGDRVRVHLTTEKGTPAAHTTVVLEQAVVYDVGSDERAGPVAVAGGGDAPATGPAGPISWASLLVTPEEGRLLTQARWAGELDLALLPAEAGR
jgi:Flp pilus assembly protein CpaB